jgi:hypothetical protein
MLEMPSSALSFNTGMDRGCIGRMTEDLCFSLDRRRFRPDFTGWTRLKDPQGIGWEFKSFTCRFHPLIEFVEDE